MPQPIRTDTSSEAQGRFVVSLPAEVGKKIDLLARKVAQKTEAEIGVAVSPTRAQIVQSLVQSALDKRNGDES